MKTSVTLRLMDRSGVRKKFRASCCVMVLVPPTRVEPRTL